MSNAAAPKPTMIGKIDDFDGTPDNAQRWILSTDLHFDINDTIYNSDKKKKVSACSLVWSRVTSGWGKGGGAAILSCWDDVGGVAVCGLSELPLALWDLVVGRCDVLSTFSSQT
ncbi:hypothetical protein SERLA73DRAFT_156290 [Serpula lacrymans var. lacrymans S7.3]|uniref:Uncharacterized protein n=1 Tax=Serpula lacrymans var. lacrymans (strain S7.3) TaxID=936435 RepID=F8QDT3_SERL3|nr:hypothetical protein SERLA73DRAFT_156290 [Serpula lacrymans var. lacrymans S7.3]